MGRETDYERVAPTYERRYAGRAYDGMARFLLDWLRPEPGLRVLELGCGTGHWLGVLGEAGCSVVGLDPAQGMLGQARDVAPGRLLRGRAESVPVARESVDRVVCVNAFHHFRDKTAGVREARRVLRPGGAFLTVGLDPHDGLDQWFVYDYFRSTRALDRDRYPSRAWIQEQMARSGFSGCASEVARHMRIEADAEEAIRDGRVDKETTSQLSILTSEEYEQGLSAIQRDITRKRAAGESLVLSSDLRLWATFGTAS